MTVLQRSLPKGAYVDAAFYEREQRHIFWDQWVYAGRSESWREPGAYSVIDVAGESIIVIRAGDGNCMRTSIFAAIGAADCCAATARCAVPSDAHTMDG